MSKPSYPRALNRALEAEMERDPAVLAQIRKDAQPGDLAPVPLGAGRVHREGSDVTVVASRQQLTGTVPEMAKSCVIATGRHR